MAKGKRISEQPILDALVGDELIPFAKNGANGAVEADTIKEYAQEGLDDKYADKSDTYTKSEVDGLVDGATSTAEATYAKKEDVPTKVSELENDSKYQTESEVDGKLTDKVDKEDGKGLSSNDYTDEDKAKLDRFELVLANDDEIEDGLHQIASSEDYRSKLKENGYVVYHDVKYKVKDCGVTSDSFPWIVTEGAVITANAEGTLNDHTQKNVVRSVYIWFDTILHYQPYNTSIPSKVSELTNDLKYTTETQVENRMAILYESLDSQLVDEYTHLDNKKVDKVEGKQLSTEDFTTLLKQKLEGLTNYDDSTLTSELNALKSRLDTLVGSGDVTAVIDTFQEIEAFLQGVTNTQTLTGLLQEMKGDIVALCADTYVTKDTAQTITGKKAFTKDIRISDNERGILIYKNVRGNAGAIEILGENGEWKYNCLDFDNDGNVIFHNKIIKKDGTSSQFLKADGSVDGTAYLPTTGSTTELKQSSTGNTAIYYLKDKNNLTSGAVGAAFNSDGLDRVFLGWGTTPYVESSSLILSDTKFAYKKNKVWHEGNDGVGSGLDADLLDGKQPADLNVGSANLLKGIDSGDTTTASGTGNISYIYDIPSNTEGLFYSVSNDNSILTLNRHYGDFYSQLGFDGYNKIYYRCFHGVVIDTTTPWKQLAFTDSNVASADKLTTKQLTNEDLNTLTVGGTSYYANGSNTCVNKPNEIGTNGFTLDVNYRGSDLLVSQTLIDAYGKVFVRSLKNDGWTNWKQLATTDGAVAKLTTKQLTNEDLNTITDGGRLYHGNKENTCDNKPLGTTGFSLSIYTIGQSCVQLLFDYFKESFYSRKSSTQNVWSPWKKMLTEDDISSLISRIEALEARPTIASVDSLPSTPNNNTLYAIPE